MKGVKGNLMKQCAPFELRCAYYDSFGRPGIDLLSWSIDLDLMTERSSQHISLESD